MSLIDMVVYMPRGSSAIGVTTPIYRIDRQHSTVFKEMRLSRMGNQSSAIMSVSVKNCLLIYRYIMNMCVKF